MTHYENRGLLALDQIEDLLEAYAEARLTPPGALMARMRLAARAAADERLPIPDALRSLEDRHASRWSGLLPRLRRYGFALGATAMLTFATGAAVLAAPPGSPFYEARMALEVAFLPAQADARFASHEEHLGTRLAEAQAAASSGDRAALEAAIGAYQAELDAAVADAGFSADLLAKLEAALAKHTAVLEALLAEVPEPAAIEHAIDTSQKAAQKIKERGAHGSGRPSEIPTPNSPGR